MVLRSRPAWTTWAVVAAVASTIAGCGSATTSGSPTTTSPPATVAVCPRFGSTGATSAAGTTGTALLRNVQIQASGCVDEVSFLFWKGTPAWSAGYQDGPLTLDPSGQPAAVSGEAHLVIRFEHASGVDLSVNPPQPAYDGPTAMTPGSPSAVEQVSRLGDFEGVLTWAVGLPDRRPFEVVARADQIVVRLAAPAPRPTSCVSPGSGVRVGYPGGWYAELSDRWACRYFDPAPFVVHPATDDFTWAVTAAADDASAATVVSRASTGGSTRSHQTRVAGRPATVLDVTTTGAGLHPAGWEYRMYVVDTTPNAFVVSGTAAPPGFQAQRNRAAVDRIAGMLTLE